MSLLPKRAVGHPTEPAEWRTVRMESGREFSVGRSITGKVLFRTREPEMEIEISVSREILPWLLGSLSALFPEPAEPARSDSGPAPPKQSSSEPQRRSP